MRIFLCTQIADEARHVAFFNRFYYEVGVLESDNLQRAARGDERAPEPDFHTLFDEMLKLRVDRLAREPEDLETLVEAITLYHMVIEGMLALTGQHFIISYNEEVGTLPASSRASTTSRATNTATWPSARASCATWRRRTTRYRDAIQRTLVEAGPAADGVLMPPWYEEGQELFGVSLDETRAFAMKALERRLKVIGLCAGCCLARSCRRARRRRPAEAGRRPSRSSAPSTSASESKPAIRLGGKFDDADDEPALESSRA